MEGSGVFDHRRGWEEVAGRLRFFEKQIKGTRDTGTHLIL